MGDGEDGGVSRTTDGEPLLEFDLVSSLSPEEGEGLRLIGVGDSLKGLNVLVPLRGRGIVDMG